MINKKIFLIVATSFLLTACGGNGDTYVYDDPNVTNHDIFDYANNETLDNAISQLFVVNEQEVTNETLDSFLSVIDSNDYYANKVVYTYTNQALYPDPVDPDNTSSRTDGDYNYQIINTLTRNNTSYSVSGTSTLHDEKWNLSASDPATLEHSLVNTSGTYLLAISSEGEVFTESYDYIDDSYDSSVESSYNDYRYFQRTNLTKSSEIAGYLTETINYVDNQNGALPTSNQFAVSFRALRNGTSFEVVYQASSSRLTSNDDTLEIKYYIDIKITDGLITETTYQYSEVEKGSNDFILKYISDNRLYSHE
ncbi:MAG: hypothetical protein WC201_02015 [Bacilli bacterium]